MTAEQIRDVARRYFVPEHLNRVVIAPPGGAPQKTRSEAARGEGEVRAARLESGLRVLVKKQSDLPLVNIQAFVLCGSLVDTDRTAGRSALLAAMLDKGTAGHSARQVADYFDSIGGRISFEAGRSTIYGSVTTLEDDFADAAALFAECFTRPAFPQAEFEKAKNLALMAIARRADDPRQEAFELFYDNLPPSSPYHLIPGGKKETVRALTAEDLRAYHAGYFVPGNMVVTVFGDVETDEALDLVRRNFSHLEPASDFQPINLERDNALKESVERHKQTGKPTGIVLIGYPGTSIRNQQDDAAMTLLDAILSGYSYPGGWLHDELRGEGLVYFVHAFQITGPAPGYFTILAQTQPEKVGEVIERIRSNVARAKAGQIAEDEFRRAQQMVIALHAQENTTISGQARQAALDELYGLGYNHDKSFDARIQAVTLEDVIRAARKYLNNHLLVTASPLAR